MRWKCQQGAPSSVYFTADGIRIVSWFSGTDCPYCANRKALADFNDLETLKPETATEQHPDLNGAFTPDMMMVSSCRRGWWQCVSGHIWKTMIFQGKYTEKRLTGVHRNNVNFAQHTYNKRRVAF